MKRQKRQSSKKTVSPDQIATLTNLLSQEKSQEKRNKRYTSTKEVLKKLAGGAVLIGMLLAPKPGYLAAKALLKDGDISGEWKQFNLSYLRQTLKRMAKQKLVRVEEKHGTQRIVITERGKKRIFEYSLDEMKIQKARVWDKKWRVIIYDIPRTKKAFQEQMRRTLKKLGFLQIQKSTYLFPYPCYKEIEFLRSYYGIGEHLKYMLVIKLEDDAVYKEYFGLK
ncbi:MAG: hypothetical protein Q8Q49_01920 [bacterium]|nr:hypothetical protein [bacterium]